MLFPVYFPTRFRTIAYGKKIASVWRLSGVSSYTNNRVPKGVYEHSQKPVSKEKDLRNKIEPVFVKSM